MRFLREDTDVLGLRVIWMFCRQVLAYFGGVALGPVLVLYTISVLVTVVLLGFAFFEVVAVLADGVLLFVPETVQHAVASGVEHQMREWGWMQSTEKGTRILGATITEEGTFSGGDETFVRLWDVLNTIYGKGGLLIGLVVYGGRMALEQVGYTFEDARGEETLKEVVTRNVKWLLRKSGWIAGAFLGAWMLIVLRDGMMGFSDGFLIGGVMLLVGGLFVLVPSVPSFMAYKYFDFKRTQLDDFFERKIEERAADAGRGSTGTY